ncbi:MAG: N-acetylglucosamine kinase [Anaerolineae bacterium]
MTRCFLGVDVGGSKSHALIADEQGRALGFGESGPGNHEVVGYDGLAHTLQTITAQALDAAGLTIEQISAAGFGLAGYDWPSEREQHAAAIETLGLRAPYEIVNDTIVGLLAGASEGWGVSIVSGTSNNCRGRDRHGREGRVTGHGPWFGEYGGGAELVMRAVHAITAEWTMRGPATRLSQAFMDLTGERTLAGLIEGLALERIRLDASAALAVFACAHAGDEVARELIAWSGRELGSLAVGVIRQLGLQDEAFEVVLVGSMHDGGPLLHDPMKAVIGAEAPGARYVRLTAPPVVGGVVLAMQQMGLETTGRRQALLESARGMGGGALTP